MQHGRPRRRMTMSQATRTLFIASLTMLTQIATVHAQAQRGGRGAPQGGPPAAIGRGGAAPAPTPPKPVIANTKAGSIVREPRDDFVSKHDCRIGGCRFQQPWDMSRDGNHHPSAHRRQGKDLGRNSYFKLERPVSGHWRWGLFWRERSRH
jgi:hypothetical protein